MISKQFPIPSDKMDKLLFVSYNHGRTNVADSIQNHRLIPSLSEYYDIDVLQRRVKDGSEGVWSPNIYIIDRLIYKLFPFLISVFSFDKWLWCILAYRRIRRSLPQYKYVAMVYEPYCIRRLQYYIRKNNGNKIVTLLYDPCVDNLFFSQAKIGIWLRKKVERSIINASDAVFVNSIMLLNTIQRRYETDKVHYVPCCAEQTAAKFESGRHKAGDRLTILHAGNIHGERRLDVLNDIVTLLKQRYYGHLQDKLQILMYGNCLEEERLKVLKRGNTDIILFKGFINGTQLNEVKKESDALLLINPVGGVNYSYPSKLCEYFQLNKIIISIGSLESAATDDLLQAGHIVCDGNNIEETVEKLRSLLADISVFDHAIDQTFYKKFLPGTVASEYNKVLESL